MRISGKTCKLHMQSRDGIQMARPGDARPPCCPPNLVGVRQPLGVPEFRGLVRRQCHNPLSYDQKVTALNPTIGSEFALGALSKAPNSPCFFKNNCMEQLCVLWSRKNREGAGWRVKAKEPTEALCFHNGSVSLEQQNGASYW